MTSFFEQVSRTKKLQVGARAVAPQGACPHLPSSLATPLDYQLTTPTKIKRFLFQSQNCKIFIDLCLKLQPNSKSQAVNRRGGPA